MPGRSRGRGERGRGGEGERGRGTRGEEREWIVKDKQTRGRRQEDYLQCCGELKLQLALLPLQCIHSPLQLLYNQDTMSTQLKRDFYCTTVTASFPGSPLTQLSERRTYRNTVPRVGVALWSNGTLLPYYTSLKRAVASISTHCHEIALSGSPTQLSIPRATFHIHTRNDGYYYSK